jgi:hypothetical protein
LWDAGEGLVAERAMAFTGWAIFRRCSSCWNRSRSSARSMASGLVPRIGMPASPAPGQLQRRLAAELDDHAQAARPWTARRDQLQHVLGRQRLEVEAVGGVVVGGNGLGLQLTMIDSTPISSSAKAAWQQQ